MVIISAAPVDDVSAAANAARTPRPPAASNNTIAPVFDPNPNGTTAADAGAGAGTMPPAWWSSPYAAPTTAPYYAAPTSGAYTSSSWPPQLQSDPSSSSSYYDMNTVFPQLPPVHMEPMTDPSYLYYTHGFQPCFAPESLVVQSATWPELQVQTTQPASMPPPLYLQAQAGTTTPSASAGAAPALADDTAAQQDARPAPRRRGRPPKRATVSKSNSNGPVFKTTKRVTVGRKRASSSSQGTSSAATGRAPATMPAAGQVQAPTPDLPAAGAGSSTNTSGHQTAACTNSPMACEEQQQLQPVPVAEGHCQQAAIALPETTTAMMMGPYADTSAVGVRYQPTDWELICYLRMKYARQPMPVDLIKEFDVYHTHPNSVKDACGEMVNGCWYVFSPRDRKYRNGNRPSRSVFAENGGEQVGFWKSNEKLTGLGVDGKKDGGGGDGDGDAVAEGEMTSLTFHLGRQPRGPKTGWKMKEYSIPENQHQHNGSAMLLNDWVICKLFYKERPVGQERRPARPRKSKKDKNAIIPVAVGQEADRSGEAGENVGRGTLGEETQQMVVPVYQVPPDYFEQDLCVDDYLVDGDVELVQQNEDAPNCTYHVM